MAPSSDPRGFPDKPAPRREHRSEAGGGSLPRRLGWFVLYWLAGIAVIGSVAYLIRLVLIG